MENGETADTRAAVNRKLDIWLPTKLVGKLAFVYMLRGDSIDCLCLELILHLYLHVWCERNQD